MKLIHTADWHLGKSVNEFSMLKDQEYILEQIKEILLEEGADGLLIAGDIYDRSIPSAEAVALFDSFLSWAAEKKIPVMLIGGNHDSPERLEFAGAILKQSGVYVSGTYRGRLLKAELEDEYGTVSVYLLPFLRPQTVKYYYPEMELLTYEEGVRRLLEETPLNTGERNILLTHYFVTAQGKMPELSDSEHPVSVGGVDNIDVSVFDAFDYVALGHIHGPQRAGREAVRYAGSPLKYSFSEVFHKKSVTVIELKEKGTIDIRMRELKPLHDMRKIKGPLKALLTEATADGEGRKDYIQAVLTDENELIDPLGMLRSVYPNVMQIFLEKNRLSQELPGERERDIKGKNTMELFTEFYEGVTGRKLEKERSRVMEEVIEAAEGGEISCGR